MFISTASPSFTPKSMGLSTALCFIAVVSGTGTAISAETISEDNQYLYTPSVVLDVDDSFADVSGVSSQQMVESILNAYGLAVKDFEPILGVKRAAIYNWKKGANQPNEAQHRKIVSLYELSNKLTSFNGKIGRLAKTYMHDGETLLDLLSSEIIDEEKVVSVHSTLVDKVIKQNETFKHYRSSGQSVEDTVVYFERNA